MPPKASDHVTTHDADEDARNRDIQIYVNGEIVHRDDAKVSVYDSGFMLGDGMWDAQPDGAYDGDHHGAFKAGGRAAKGGHPVGHRAAGARAADVARRQV